MRVVLLAMLAVSTSCLPSKGSEAPPAPFADDFERAELGPHYRKQGGSFRIDEGKLRTFGDHNLPLWLDVPLARNTRVEFTTISRSPAVDTKIEIFGDGLRHESGYSVILAGWQNRISVIARNGEHEPQRKELRRAFEKDRVYHWVVQRTDGHTLELFVDGEKLLAYDDPAPLYGPKNNKLGFSSWETDCSYDDLKITPLP
jgi:hypothetical protein